MWAVFLINRKRSRNHFSANFKGNLMQSILLYTLNNIKIGFLYKKSIRSLLKVPHAICKKIVELFNFYKISQKNLIKMPKNKSVSQFFCLM